MKVRATQKGYNGKRVVKEGEEFTLKDDKLFSERWMAKAEGEKRGPGRPPASKPEPAKQE